MSGWTIIQSSIVEAPKIEGNTVIIPKRNSVIWYMRKHILICDYWDHIQNDSFCFINCDRPRRVPLSQLPIPDEEKMKIRCKVKEGMRVAGMTSTPQILEDIVYEDNRYYTLEALCD